MMIWNDFEFNGPLESDIISKINDIELPKDYIDFMKEHNGGEGDIGSMYVILFEMDELVEINEDYCIEEFMPHNCIIGSNGGGELFGIDMNQNYFVVPTIMDGEDKTILGRTLYDFMVNLNRYFED